MFQAKYLISVDVKKMKINNDIETIIVQKYLFNALFTNVTSLSRKPK